uniref:Uncharacterized protein n=1 Tax=Ralstonia solanacearum TaxID=305 RepID=A0A0S4VZA8_RALSL|nr:conserved protein of unknown function [Ralstonia solanacearum]CUV35197.1 conserved protein of unknown function [Ralstonia solanacearum]CUV39578.1 conserved protein of unknown function [Ralstonia solanacearum]CUV61408.1 conserved protein of unknown function [Ralstonia solanacearum]
MRQARPAASASSRVAKVSQGPLVKCTCSSAVAVQTADLMVNTPRVQSSLRLSLR